jgi:hypothetical protein
MCNFRQCAAKPRHYMKASEGFGDIFSNRITKLPKEIQMNKILATSIACLFAAGAFEGVVYALC